MTDVDTDYGDVVHQPTNLTEAEREWIDCLQDVLDEVTADMVAASPTGRPWDGTMISDQIDGDTRPLVACTWLELTQVASHWWLPSNPENHEAHTAAWRDLQTSAERAAMYAEYPQALHRHLRGAPCNRGCRLVRPNRSAAGNAQTGNPTGRR